MKSSHILIIFFLLGLIGCGGPTMESTSPSQSGGGGNQSPTCDLNGTWSMHVSKQTVVNGSCPLGGASACDPCSIVSQLDVAESAGVITLESYLTGLPMGSTFEGTLNGLDQIDSLLPFYTGSSLTADYDDSACTIEGQLIWSPDGTCEATLDFAAEKN